MAVITGTVHDISTVRADVNAAGGVQWALVLFTLSGTYAQADNAQLTSVHTAITNSRRNGKTVTLRDAMLAQPATKSSDPSAILALKTVAVSTNDITFEVTDADYTTEHAGATITAQDRPFGVLVAFTEA